MKALRDAAYRAKNVERLKAAKQAHRLRNAVHYRQKARARYLKHKTKMVASAKAYYYANRDAIRAHHKTAHRADPRVGMFKAAQVRAKKRKMLFRITVEDIVIPAHCPILGIPIVVGDGVRCHGSPSLDRVNPKVGYIPGNCRVISFRANTIKNDGTIYEHERVLAYMRGEI